MNTKIVEHADVWMNAATAETLAALEARDAEERAAGKPASVRLRQIDRTTGPFLTLITRICRPRRLIEIGTSHGYSTVWLALGADRAEIHTIELEGWRAAAARETLRRAGLAERVRIWQGDACEILPRLEGPFNLAFIDAEKENYHRYFERLEPRLGPGAVVLADNVTSHPGDVAPYLDLITNRPQWLSVTVPIDRGVEVSYRLRREKPAIVGPLGRLLFALAGAAAPEVIILVGSEAEARRPALEAAVADLGGSVALTRARTWPSPAPGHLLVADAAALAGEVPPLPPGAALIVLGPLAPRPGHDVATAPIGDGVVTFVVRSVK